MKARRARTSIRNIARQGPRSFASVQNTFAQTKTDTNYANKYNNNTNLQDNKLSTNTTTYVATTRRVVTNSMDGTALPASLNEKSLTMAHMASTVDTTQRGTSRTRTPKDNHKHLYKKQNIISIKFKSNLNANATVYVYQPSPTSYSTVELKDAEIKTLNTGRYDALRDKELEGGTDLERAKDIETEVMGDKHQRVKQGILVRVKRKNQSKNLKVHFMKPTSPPTNKVHKTIIHEVKRTVNIGDKERAQSIQTYKGVPRTTGRYVDAPATATSTAEGTSPAAQKVQTAEGKPPAAQNVQTIAAQSKQVHKTITHEVTSTIKLRDKEEAHPIRTIKRVPSTKGKYIDAPASAAPAAHSTQPEDNGFSPTVQTAQTDTPSITEQVPGVVQPADIFLHGQPFNPPQVDKMPELLRRRLHHAAKRCVVDARQSIEQLCKRVPKVSSCRFAEAIEIAMSYAPEHETPDFSPVELFKVAEGSTTIETSDARDLFELLFVGLGCFPAGCELEWSVKPTINSNPRKLMVRVGQLPGEVPKYDPISGKERLMSLCSDEVTARRYMGPFTLKEAMALFPEGLVVSSGFIISKPKALTTAHRLVHNGSSRESPNINGATVDDYQVRLDHTSYYLEMVREQLRVAAGRPVFQVVADVSKCYRRFGVRSADRARYCLRCDVQKDAVVPFFDGNAASTVTTKTVKKGEMLIYCDTRLPFGMSASVSSCVRITNFMRDLIKESILGKAGTVAAYIDDFAIVGQKTVVDVAIAYQRGLMIRVGLPENIVKMQLVSQLSIYLGVVYNYNGLDGKASIALTEKKCKAYLKHVNAVLSRPNIKFMKRTELDSLVGKLAHCAQVFAQAKIFYQRLLAALRINRGWKVPIGQQELDDLRWWRVLLMSHRGTVILDPADWQNQDTHKIYTDASQTGYGVMFEGKYFYGSWDADTCAAIAREEISINELELVCLNMALETWGKEMNGKRIIFRCDNTSCVHNIEKESSQQTMRAALLRRLYVVAGMYGIQLKSTWIPTIKNLHADYLSRNKLTQFLSLPQKFPLLHVEEPCLDSVALLTDPLGPANPSSPEWTFSWQTVRN